MRYEVKGSNPIVGIRVFGNEYICTGCLAPEDLDHLALKESELITDQSTWGQVYFCDRCHKLLGSKEALWHMLECFRDNVV